SADRLGQFRRELVHGDCLHARLDLGNQLCHAWADAVVATQRVANAYHQRPAHSELPRTRSASNVPSAARSVTCSGICPKAWVEQLRHGSNVRMPDSTRFSISSLNSGPFK